MNENEISIIGVLAYIASAIIGLLLFFFPTESVQFVIESIIDLIAGYAIDFIVLISLASFLGVARARDGTLRINGQFTTNDFQLSTNLIIPLFGFLIALALFITHALSDFAQNFYVNLINSSNGPNLMSDLQTIGGIILIIDVLIIIYLIYGNGE